MANAIVRGAMARVEIVPFAEEHLGAAASLLAERHRQHRLREPLLPARFEDPAAAYAELESAWRRESASGVVALAMGRVVGYLVGAPQGPIWGANIWVEAAGHAVEEPEVTRDLYGAAAGRWVDEGNTRHYVLIPAGDAPLTDAWFHVGFGLQHVHAIRELTETPLPESPPGFQVGPAEERDVDDLVSLAPLLSAHQAVSPVFGKTTDDDLDEVRAEVLEEIASPETGCLVAESGDRVVGNVVVVPTERSSTHAGLARPDAAALLAFAVTLPEVRGTGAGVALTAASFRWARARGYEAMVADWRATNLLASRFWPARGFRVTFQRLYRSIP